MVKFSDSRGGLARQGNLTKIVKSFADLPVHFFSVRPNLVAGAVASTYIRIAG